MNHIMHTSQALYSDGSGYSVHPSYVRLLSPPCLQVMLRTARLVAQWQCVGFCHGVLNTDNMSILGLTLDYGPYGFMDRLDICE